MFLPHRQISGLTFLLNCLFIYWNVSPLWVLSFSISQVACDDAADKMERAFILQLLGSTGTSNSKEVLLCSITSHIPYMHFIRILISNMLFYCLISTRVSLGSSFSSSFLIHCTYLSRKKRDNYMKESKLLCKISTETKLWNNTK